VLAVKQAFFYTECIVVSLDPGRPKTDMNLKGLTPVQQAGLSKADTGSFISWEGKKLEW
jgi:hypothetical protein